MWLELAEEGFSTAPLYFQHGVSTLSAQARLSMLLRWLLRELAHFESLSKHSATATVTNFQPTGGHLSAGDMAVGGQDLYNRCPVVQPVLEVRDGARLTA